MADRFLLADVGGTNTRVGLGGEHGLDPASVDTFRNAEHGGLADILTLFLTQHTGPVDALCAGVAGPVRDSNAQLTNFNWFIDASALQAATGAKSVYLMNDLQAQGYALDDLPAQNVVALTDGALPPPDATRLVFGLGTGCNIAAVHRVGQGLFVPPSETGHTSMPHLEGDAGALITYLSQTHYHKPIEAAISGPGLARIFRYLSGETLTAPDILRAYGAGDVHATATMMMFTEILGTVLGNVALSHLPMGGIFLIGGTARGVAPHLEELGFHEFFTAKGPYAPIAQDIPLFLIGDDSAALRGCARFLLQERNRGFS